MALYYTLPVYKASYELVFALFACSSDFAREYKYTIGQQLKDEGLALIKNIYRANKVQDKSPALVDARENVEMMRLLLRLMQDFRQVPLKKFVVLNMMIENVSRQLTAWESYSKGNKKKESFPPESSGSTRAQTSVRSESHNPPCSTQGISPDAGRVT